MNKKYVYFDLYDELKKHDEYKDVNGELLKSEVISKIKQLDEKTMSIILSFPEMKDRFTKKLNDTVLLDQQSLLSFFQSREFINNSFTEYTNKIGLTNGLKFLDHSDEVVLDFPYKDCVLLGNQSREENEGVRQKFFHEVINFQEIDRLFTKKVLCNFQKHTRDGIVPIGDFKETDNLVIKGNNLIALHTIKEKFSGKVKLIYIDPPYNTESLKFAYNDKFDQATWLNFMKNRLEIAKDLLKDDGVLVVHLDDNQVFYLKCLLDGIFGSNNFINSIAVLSSTPSGVKTAHRDTKIIKTKDWILIFAKNKSNIKINPQYKIQDEWDTHFNGYFDKKNNTTFSLKDVVENLNIYPKGTPLNKYTIKDKKFKDFLINHAKNIFQTGKSMPEDIRKDSLKNKNTIILYEDTEGKNQYALNGRRLSFLSNSIHKCIIQQGENFIESNEISTLLCDFWDDINFNNTQNEGAVSLPSGKKPEELLYRIISLFTNNSDIVLDYHLGSGTTCAVSHKIGRQYIGIEQLDYGQNDSIIRLENVINGEKGGISSALNWKGGGEFISMNLYSVVDEILEQIKQAKNHSDIDDIINLLLSEKYFYYLGIDENKNPYEEIFLNNEFKNKSIDEQKIILHASIDKNNLYVDLNDLHDNIVNISKEEKQLNEKFYKDNK